MEMRCSRLSLAPSSSSVSSSEGNFALGRLDGSLGFAATGQAPAPSSPALSRSASGFEQGISSARMGREVCEVLSFVRSSVVTFLSEQEAVARGAHLCASGSRQRSSTAHGKLDTCILHYSHHKRHTLGRPSWTERAAEPIDALDFHPQHHPGKRTFLPNLSFDFGTFLEIFSDFPVREALANRESNR